MRLFPVLIDARPSYLEMGTAPTSLLLSPLGSSTLFGYFRDRIAEVSESRITVLTTFEPTKGYEAALRNTGVAVEDVHPASAFRSRLIGLEPSDWLLIAEARRIPTGGLDFVGITRNLIDDARRVRHQVALEPSIGGTKECIQFGPEERVTRVQRYYESVTWPFAEGVPCSVIPVASTVVARDLPFSSLDKLRAALAALGVPSRDMTLTGGTFDLFDEAALLALNERLIVQGPRSPEAHVGSGRALVSARSAIHSSAKLVGPVAVHEDVFVGPGATIVGPCLLGAGSRVEAQATVAQSLVFPGATVSQGATVRQRVVVVSSEGLDPIRRGSKRLVAEADLPFAQPPGGCVESLSDLSDNQVPSSYPALKRAFECVVALVALILLAPLLAILAVLVKLDSKGPVFYGDRREGRGGRGFRCWKFRSMRRDANSRQRELLASNQVDGPQFKMQDDPRVTRLGRLLRPTNLDELPQLFNVLVGDMSFVGPRPSPFRENQMCIPWREARLSVRPGITGLWQVCRSERANGDFHQWIYYDMLYVRFMSPWLDVKILLATLVALAGRKSIPLASLIASNDYQEQPRPGHPLISLLGRAAAEP